MLRRRPDAVRGRGGLLYQLELRHRLPGRLLPEPEGLLYPPRLGLHLRRRLLQRSRPLAVLQRQLLHLERVQLQDDRRLLLPVGLHQRRLQLIERGALSE